MHRFLYLAQPRADLTLDEFQERWQGHARLAATCPDVLEEVRGYRQWQVAAPGNDGVVGVAETRCADAAAVYRMLECPGTREVLQPDELRFLASPCRETGLVADDVALESSVADNAAATGSATVALHHGCLWLAPRLATGTSAPAVLEEQIGAMRALFVTAVASTEPADASSSRARAHELSLGHCDRNDEASPFAALLFARFASAALAAAVAEAWRAALQPGENVWQLQRAVRRALKTEPVS